MNQLIASIKTNPARVVALITALLALLVSFGVPITVDQSTKIVAFVAAALVLFVGQAERALPPKGDGESRGCANLGLMAAIALLGASCLLLAQGCAGSFEEAKLAGLNDPRLAAAPDVPRCHELDDAHRTWGAVGKSAAVLAGASGLATIPSPSEEADIALAGGALAAGAVAAGAIYVSESAGESWARECSR